jgi:carbon monoxide dehydrogenase subunit G
VAATPEEVFRFLTDLERAPEWVPELLSMERMSEGDLGVGSRYAQLARMVGRPTRTEIVVTEYDPPCRCAHEGGGESMRFAARFTVEKHPWGSRVRHDYEYTLSGAMMLLEPLIDPWLQKNAEAAIENVKRALLRRGESQSGRTRSRGYSARGAYDGL